MLCSRRISKDNFNVCLRNKRSDGLYVVAIRFYYQGVERYIGTEYRVAKSNWANRDLSKQVLSLKYQLMARVEESLTMSKENLEPEKIIKVLKGLQGGSKVFFADDPAPADMNPSHEQNAADLHLIIERLDRLERVFLDAIQEIKQGIGPERTDLDYLDGRGAARLIKSTAGSVYNLVQQKKIPYLKIGRRVLFKKIELEEWLDEGRSIKRQVIFVKPNR